jgi:hypothetical protein
MATTKKHSSKKHSSKKHHTKKHSMSHKSSTKKSSGTHWCFTCRKNIKYDDSKSIIKSIKVRNGTRKQKIMNGECGHKIYLFVKS